MGYEAVIRLNEELTRIGFEAKAIDCPKEAAESNNFSIAVVCGSGQVWLLIKTGREEKFLFLYFHMDTIFGLKPLFKAFLKNNYIGGGDRGGFK